MIVFKYGLLNPNQYEAVDDQLRLANQMWNELVAAEKEHQKQRKVLLALDTLPENADERKKELAKRKADNKDTLKVLNDELNQQTTSIRKSFGKKGLHWGNYNAVMDSFKEAKKRIFKYGGELQFHRFDGTGSIVIRTHQAEGSKTGLSPNKLMSGKYGPAWLEKISAEDFDKLASNKGHKRGNNGGKYVAPQPKSKTREERRYLLHLRVDAAKTIVTWPLILHRSFPKNVHIQRITVTKKRVGSRFVWHACFTLKGSGAVATPVHPSQEVCGINFGWSTHEKGLHIATVVGTDEAVTHYVLDGTFLLAMNHLEKLQKKLADDANAMHDILKQWPVVPQLQQEWDKAIRAQNPTTRGKRMTELVIAWAQQCPTVEEQKLHELDKWRRHSKRRYDMASNLRDKLISQKLKDYQKVAFDIANKYHTVVLDDMDLSKSAEIPRTEVECEDGTILSFKKQSTAEKHIEKKGGKIIYAPPKDNELHASARAQRQRVAIFELRKWIEYKAEKSMKVSIKSSCTCSVCQSELTERASIVTCPSCGTVLDSDENAALNLCREAASAPVMPKGPGTARTNEIKEICKSRRIERGKKRSMKSTARKVTRKTSNSAAA